MPDMKVTDWMINKARELGWTETQAANEWQVARASVRRAAMRNKITLPGMLGQESFFDRGPHYRKVIQDMMPVDAVNYLLEVLESLQAPVLDTDWIMPEGVKLSTSERILFRLLAEHKGKVVTREALYNRLYGHRPDDPPDIHILNVYICKINKKCKGLGLRVKVMWGIGLYLEGKLEPWPWENYNG